MEQQKKALLKNSKKTNLNILPEVYQKMEKWAKSNTKIELGGFALGKVTEQKHCFNVLYNVFLPAQHTEAMRGNVTFTHESWQALHEEKEKKYANLKIIGWVHTHPGFGIFLSGYDKFIQQNFFNLPWQIAYVIDPVANERGCFVFSNEKIIQIPFKLKEKGNFKAISEIQKIPKSEKSKNTEIIKIKAKLKAEKSAQLVKIIQKNQKTASVIFLMLLFLVILTVIFSFY